MFAPKKSKQTRRAPARAGRPASTRTPVPVQASQPHGLAQCPGCQRENCPQLDRPARSMMVRPGDPVCDKCGWSLVPSRKPTTVNRCGPCVREHGPPPGPKLRVWWIPQVPGVPFHVEVAMVDEARKILHVLADYDKFQFDHKVKPDYSNVGGLEVYTANGPDEPLDWEEWRDDNNDHDVWGNP